MAEIVLLTLKFIGQEAAQGAIGAILKEPVVMAFDGLYKWFFKSARVSQALNGIWHGTVEQTSGTKQGKYRLLLRFVRRRGSALLEGRGLLWPDAQKNNPKLLNITALHFAAYLQGEHLRIDFRNADPNKVQFGAILAEVSGKRDTITGNFAAIAISDKKPAAGSVTLSKRETMLDITLG